MARPPRRSLAERNAEAIAATERESTSEAPAPEPETAPAAAPARTRTATKKATGAAPRRSSVYLDETEYRNARSAYLVDFDHRQGSAGSFGRWAADAVVEFAELTVKQRQAARKQLGTPGTGPQKSPKLLLDADVIEAVDAAMREDRTAGVVDRSQSAFYAYALRWQSAQARARAGLTELPEPPERLPILYRR